MELWRRNSKVQSFDTIKGDLIYAHLGYSLVVVQKELMGFAPLIREMSGSSKSVIDYTHYINGTVLCLGTNDVNLVNEEVFKQS
jgi:hypothetical protein